jgi:hypothetical protein
LQKLPGNPSAGNEKPFTKLDFTLAAPGKIHNSPLVMNRYLPLVLIVGLLLAFRIIGSAFPESLPNFQPLAAVFFCGALLAPGWRGFAIPFGIWAITFPLGVGHVANPLDFASTLLALVMIYLMGKVLTHRGIPVMLLGSAAAAVVFHLVTCGAAWITDPLYSKNLEGLFQSVWSGPVASKVPSWIFLRNLTAANVLFTAIFAIAQLRLPASTVPVSGTAFAK